MSDTGPRVWSVFDRDGRLVVGLSEEPGEFNFTRLPDEDAEILEIPWGSLQCYQTRAEPELLTLVARAQSLDELVEGLRARGYRVVAGRPRPNTFARL